MASISGADVPKQQKQKPLDNDLPSDPAERKRVLNVLAQRRYRRRKREQQSQLEDFIRALNGSSSSSNSNSNSTRSRSKSTLNSLSNSSSGSNSGLQNSSDNDGSPEVAGDADFEPALANSSSLHSETLEHDELPSWSASGQSDSAMSDIDITSLLNLTPEPRDTGGSTDTPINLNFENEVGFPVDLPLSSSQDFAFQLSSFLQNDEIQNSAFADDYYVSVPELDLLRASYLIASRLNSVDRVFDPNGTSIFQSSEPFDWSLLPENLRPTSTQLSLPHHPVLDLIPWPKVRTKLITMFSMPPETWPRHPADHAEMSPFRLVCDMEDGGIRVYGEDPTNQVSWELQQHFVDAWWWALDQGVICLSNQRKQARGEETLKIGKLSS